MIQEIKFRGRHKVSNCWYYGYLYKQDNDWIITTDGYTRYVVEMGSVGQDTGLKDKNGKEIYEGDLLHYGLGVNDIDGSVWEVEWDKHTLGWYCFVHPDESVEGTGCNSLYYLNTQSTLAIVGNIYENPELLK